MDLSRLPEAFLAEKMFPDAEIPEFATPGASGRDMRAYLNSRDVTFWDAQHGISHVVQMHPEGAKLILHPHDRALIPTGIKVAVPVGYEVQVRARSGLAIKHGLTLINGVGTVDSDYRGELLVPVINLGFHPVTVEHGMRISQAIVAPYARDAFIETFDLVPTARGEGGFGSTGL